MTDLNIAIAALAVWRLTHLLNVEDGPFHAFESFRRMLRGLSLGGLIDCFYCLSVWVAGPFAIWIGNTWTERGTLGLALSGAAILINRSVEEAPQSALFFEEPYQEEISLCHAAEAQESPEFKTHRPTPARSA